jgi:hypothetical protein
VNALPRTSEAGLIFAKLIKCLEPEGFLPAFDIQIIIKRLL